MRKSDTFTGDLLLAFVLLTRLPLPYLPKSAFQRQAQAVWAFPVVGLTVGGVASLLAYFALLIGLSPAIAAGISLAVMILATGAMHEDGLADTADGLWGGFTRERRLEIMKDSQIGTYGVLALILGVGLRWSALTSLFAGGGVLNLVAIAVLSRSMMPLLMYSLPNARQSGLSQSVGKPSSGPIWVGLLLAMILAISVLGWASILVTLAMIGATALLGALARRKIGGQTGDILGATQQVTELTGLLVLIPLLA